MVQNLAGLVLASIDQAEDFKVRAFRSSVNIPAGVMSLGNFGFITGGVGGGRGLRYLSSGSKVCTAAAKMIEFDLLLLPDCRIWRGTSRTFRVWPGRNGQEVVEGSAGL